MSEDRFALNEELTINTKTPTDLMNILSDGLKVVAAIEDDDAREQALRFLLGLSDEFEVANESD